MIGWRKQGWIQRRRQTQAVCSSYVIVMTRAAYLGGSLRHSTLCSRANSDTRFINHSEHRDGGVHLPAISDCSQITYKGCCMTNYWWELIFKVWWITFRIDNHTHKWMVCVFWGFFLGEEMNSTWNLVQIPSALQFSWRGVTNQNQWLQELT